MTSNSGSGPAQAESESAGAEFEGGPIVGRVELTAEDFTAVWGVLPQNRRIPLHVGLWLVAIPLCWLATVMLNADSAEPGHVTWLVAMAPVALVAGQAFAFWRGRGAWAKNALADLRAAEGVEYRFDSAGVSFHAPGRNLQITWSSLHRCIETPIAFAIYTSPAGVLVVPKRAFAAAEQATLRTRLLELVPNRPLRGTPIWQTLARLLLLTLVLVVSFLAIWHVMESN